MAELQILGSAAAEGIPAMFCNCDVCKAAWENGGKDVRMRSAYKISDTIRIDFGPDTLAQEYKYQLHSEKLKHLFVTHSHEDHFYPELLVYRMPGFSKVDEDNILNIYGNPGVMHAIQKFFWAKPFQYFDGDYKKFRMNLVPLQAFDHIVIEEEDFEIYALKADHMINIASEIPMFYVFRHGSSWAMVANDTGYFREETWEFLESKKFKFDLVITDCTGGLLNYERGHMSGSYVVDTKKRLEKIGSVTENTQYYINHFSHNGKATHKDLEARFNPEGIKVGYDGLIIKY